MKLMIQWLEFRYLFPSEITLFALHVRLSLGFKMWLTHS